MEHNDFKQLHNQLSWNTKIYTLLAIGLIVFSKLSNALETDFALAIILALLLILFVESLVIVSTKHLKAWHYIKWFLIFIGIGFMLLGHSTSFEYV